MDYKGLWIILLRRLWEEIGFVGGLGEEIGLVGETI